MKEWTAFPIRFLLTAICDNPDSLTPEQRAGAGMAARNLFDLAWGEQSRNGNLLQGAIVLVAKSFETDPGRSRELLRKVISPENLRLFGHHDMQALGQEIKRLA